jgi:Tfp pilus assembly protein FimT
MIELMVVLAIIVIMSGVVALAMQPALRDARIRGGCRMIASELNYARSFAVSKQSDARVVFTQSSGSQGQNSAAQVERMEVDIPSQSTTPTGAADSPTGSAASSALNESQQWTPLTTTAGRPRNLPDGIVIAQIAKSDGTTDNWVDFTDQGTAESVMIVVTDQDQQKRYLVVDQITGRCRIFLNAPTQQSQENVH